MPHYHISALNRPTPVRSLLSLTQACLGSSDSGQHLDGEAIYSRSPLVDCCHSADHILPIQWAFVSLGRAIDRRSFPLVAKGCRDFSLSWVSSLVMVWWRRWSGSKARRDRARLATRLRRVGTLRVKYSWRSTTKDVNVLRHAMFARRFTPSPGKVHSSYKGVGTIAASSHHAGVHWRCT